MIKVLENALKKKRIRPAKTPERKAPGNPDLHKHAKKFSAEYQTTPEQREKAAKTLKKKTKRKRDLLELLQMSLSGDIGQAIQAKFKDAFGTKPRDIREALDMVMVAKVITQKDTYAYTALMQGAGLNKPVKVDHTTNGQSINAPAFDYSKLSTEDLLKLKEINEKCLNNGQPEE